MQAKTSTLRAAAPAKRAGFFQMLGRFLVFATAILAAWCMLGGLIGLAYRVALWVVP